VTAALSPFAWLAIANGWGQLSLAEASGVPSDTIRRLWLGRNRPSHRTANQLAGLLGVDPADVIDPLSWLVGHGLAPAAPSARQPPNRRPPQRPLRRGRWRRRRRESHAPTPLRRRARPAGEPGRRAVRSTGGVLAGAGRASRCGAGGMSGLPGAGRLPGGLPRAAADEGGVWFATTLLDRQARSARQAVAA